MIAKAYRKEPRQSRHRPCQPRTTMVPASGAEVTFRCKAHLELAFKCHHSARVRFEYDSCYFEARTRRPKLQAFNRRRAACSSAAL